MSKKKAWWEVLLEKLLGIYVASGQEPLPTPKPAEPVEGPVKKEETAAADAAGREADEGGGKPDEFAGCLVHEAPQESTAFQIAGTLKITLMGSRMRLEISNGADRRVWPLTRKGAQGAVWCLLFRNGRWHGDPCDALKPFSNGTVKELSCLCIGKNNARIMEPNDERVGVLVTVFCRNGEMMSPPNRTQIVWLTIQNGKWMVVG